MENTTSNYFYCNNLSHSGCELSTICASPSCSERGLICYLCSFTKPHLGHSRQDIIPIELIKRSENERSVHNIVVELEHELKCKQDSYLSQIKILKAEVLEIFNDHEKKAEEIFRELQVNIELAKEDDLEKFKKKRFNSQMDFQHSANSLIKKIVKQETPLGYPNWVYEDIGQEYFQIVNNTKLGLENFDSQLREMKKQLESIVSESFHSIDIELNTLDSLNNISPKKINLVDNASIVSTCRASERSDNQSDVGLTERACETLGNNVKKQRERQVTFGKGHNLLEESLLDLSHTVEDIPEKKNYTKIKKANNKAREFDPAITRDSNEGRMRKFVHRRNVKHVEEKSDELEEPRVSPQKHEICLPDDLSMEIGDYTIIKDYEECDGGLEFGSRFINSDIRFVAGKDEIQRWFRKPEERFDAITFYSKAKDIILEGFGFYCPLPCDGAKIDLEYRIYDPTLKKDKKELRREHVSIECDVTSVKENSVVERILLKEPVRLERKKWYTLVLCYLNEVKMETEVRKWRDVGPFIFMGVEKGQVKEWLGVKTNEAEKMHSSQFPYLTYSELK